MTKRIDCRYCGEGTMTEEIFSETIKSGRSNLLVSGLLRWRCSNCDSVMTDAEQFASNATSLQAAEQASPAFVSRPMLREFREKYSLSQREAGLVIGAGEAAFGKYESGSRISAPTAKLIRVALAFPAVARMLIEEEGIDVNNEIEG